ncbi:MAG: hypothetical protein U1F43_17065 [Myxococcota bacterium]
MTRPLGSLWSPLFASCLAAALAAWAACSDPSLRPLGAACEDASDCASGLCYESVCIDPETVTTGGEPTATPFEGSLSEVGAGGALTVSLPSKPGALVTMTVSASPAGAVAIEPSSFSFAADAAPSPQTVNVVGVDDDLATGHREVTLTFVAKSLDPGWNGKTTSTKLLVLDNDLAQALPLYDTFDAERDLGLWGDYLAHAQRVVVDGGFRATADTGPMPSSWAGLRSKQPWTHIAADIVVDSASPADTGHVRTPLELRFRQPRAPGEPDTRAGEFLAQILFERWSGSQGQLIANALVWSCRDAACSQQFPVPQVPGGGAFPQYSPVAVGATLHAAISYDPSKETLTFSLGDASAVLEMAGIPEFVSAEPLDAGFDALAFDNPASGRSVIQATFDNVELGDGTTTRQEPFDGGLVNDLWNQAERRVATSGGALSASLVGGANYDEVQNLVRVPPTTPGRQRAIAAIQTLDRLSVADTHTASAAISGVIMRAQNLADDVPVDVDVSVGQHDDGVYLYVDGGTDAESLRTLVPSAPGVAHQLYLGWDADGALTVIVDQSAFRFPLASLGLGALADDAPSAPSSALGVSMFNGHDVRREVAAHWDEVRAGVPALVP